MAGSNDVENLVPHKMTWGQILLHITCKMDSIPVLLTFSLGDVELSDSSLQRLCQVVFFNFTMETHPQREGLAWRYFVE